MKKIAIIMDGWKRYFTYAWPAGILQRIHETGEEVNLYIFTSSGNWSKDADYTIGEYNIYRLPKLEEFDGIILDLNNIICEDVQKEIVERVRKARVPAISIGRDVDGFYYVGINNYSAMQSMIAHLYECHGCTDYWLIMGPRGNYENEQRVTSLKDYMEKQGIMFGEDCLYYGSFDYRCGAKGFEELYSRKGRLPEAIICANDNIAVGVCESVKAKGFRIPEDVRVTGFDNFDKAGCYEPRITTLEHNREETGYCCADLFIKMWSGEQVPKYTYTEIKGIFWDSCGCKSERILDARGPLKDQILYGIETSEFDEEVLFLEYELLQCNTVEEMMNCIPQCIPSMKCDAMYLVLDEHINAFKEQAELSLNQQFMEDEDFCVIGYPETMEVSFAYENGRTLDLTDKKISGIFPMFDYEKGGENFLFLPLHFRSRTVGYFVIRNAVYLLEKQYLFQVIKAMTTGIENLHKKEKLEYMNQLLSDLYIKDALTGMYNRFGYQRLAVSYFRKMQERGASVLILFIDLDRLKYINDEYGHEMGDLAIVSTAKAILKYCDKEAIPARTGGDEFVLVQRAVSEAETKALIRNIRMEMEETEEKQNLPFPLSVSIGTAVTEVNDGKSLEDYVREADEMMYREKTEKKMRRTVM